jgi:hypothetical protein
MTMENVECKGSYGYCLPLTLAGSALQMTKSQHQFVSSLLVLLVLATMMVTTFGDSTSIIFQDSVIHSVNQPLMTQLNSSLVDGDDD